MKHVIKFLTFSLLFACVLTSCSSDDDNFIETPTSLGDFENGYFILNEGSSDFTSPVTFVGDDGIVFEDVFETINPGAEPVGTYLQDMFFDDSRAFIISGSANKITVFDRYTFEFITTIDTDFMAPRFGTVIDGKAYVTNTAEWDNNTDDFITIIDLNNYSTSTLNVNKNAEKITTENGKVFISNGYYGIGNTITILNPATQGMESLDLGADNSPNSMEIKNGVLYVLTYNYVSNGKVFKINLSNNEIINTVDIPSSITDTKNLKVEDNIVYFTSGASVYSFGTSDSIVSETPLLTYNSTSAYGIMYGFDVENNKLYIADGGDFNSASNAYEYSLSGTLLKTITTGIGPNGFFFN